MAPTSIICPWSSCLLSLSDWIIGCVSIHIYHLLFHPGFCRHQEGVEIPRHIVTNLLSPTQGDGLALIPRTHISSLWKRIRSQTHFPTIQTKCPQSQQLWLLSENCSSQFPQLTPFLKTSFPFSSEIQGRHSNESKEHPGPALARGHCELHYPAHPCMQTPWQACSFGFIPCLV